jgi:hypothetical protein
MHIEYVAGFIFSEDLKSMVLVNQDTWNPITWKLKEGDSQITSLNDTVSGLTGLDTKHLQWYKFLTVTRGETLMHCYTTKIYSENFKALTNKHVSVFYTDYVKNLKCGVQMDWILPLALSSFKNNLNADVNYI